MKKVFLSFSLLSSFLFVGSAQGGCFDLTQLARLYTFPEDNTVYIRNFSAICDTGGACRNSEGGETIFDYSKRRPRFVLGEFPHVSQDGCRSYSDGRGTEYSLTFVDDTTIYFDSHHFNFDLNIVDIEDNYAVVVFSYWTQVIGIPTLVHIIAGHGHASRAVVEQTYHRMRAKRYFP